MCAQSIHVVTSVTHTTFDVTGASMTLGPYRWETERAKAQTATAAMRGGVALVTTRLQM